jgi:haloacetate dehalogenase
MGSMKVAFRRGYLNHEVLNMGNDLERLIDGDRRQCMKSAGALAVTAILGSGATRAQEQSVDSTLFFPGFLQSKVQTAGATINVLKAGIGPPLLLLHGAPQSHISWRLVAPELAKRYTVIATDLRGYGDSSAPEGGDNHVNYSKRVMAQDQIDVMKHFGYDSFDCIGHDRGGRVAHRMALDHPKAVKKLVLIDIVPTYYLYTHVTIEFIQAYYHWFANVRPAPVPENEMLAQAEARRSRLTTDVQREYFRTTSKPENIHALCEDYRAGASIDLQHDAADLNKKIQCPLLVLWGGLAPMGKIYDVLTIWKERGVDVTGKSLPGGHTLQEDEPEMLVSEVLAFMK